MKDFLTIIGGSLAITLALSLALTLLLSMLVGGDPRPAYAESCRAHGGHIYQPGSIAFCLSTDGRMIEAPAKP